MKHPNIKSLHIVCVNLYEMSKISKSTETKCELVFITGWEKRKGMKSDYNVYAVPLWSGKYSKIRSDGCPALNTLNNTKLHALKG